MSLNQTSDDEERRGGQPQAVQEIVQTSRLRQQSRILAQQRNEEGDSSMCTSRYIENKDNVIAGCLILSVIFFLSGAVMMKGIPTSTQAYGSMFLMFSICYFPHCIEPILNDEGQDNRRICYIPPIFFQVAAGIMYFVGAFSVVCEGDTGGNFYWYFGAIMRIIQFTFELMEYIRMNDRPKLKLLEKSLGILMSLSILIASFIAIDFSNFGDLLSKSKFADFFLAAAIFHALYSILVIFDMLNV